MKNFGTEVENFSGLDDQEPSEEYFKEFNEFASWLKGQKEGKDADASKIILDEIGPEELRIFGDYRKGSLTEEELRVCQQKYTDSFVGVLKGDGKTPEEIQRKIIIDSRSSFYAIILNRLIVENMVKRKR